MSNQSFFRRLIRHCVHSAAHHLRNTQLWADFVLLQGQQAALQVQRLEQLRSLGDAEFRAFSQWGEDGILEWLVSRLPKIPQTLVEFGVGDYTESNTRFLVCNRNWHALIMDGGEANMDFLRRHSMSWRHDIRAVTAFIDRDNINDLLRKNGFGEELGILSIDIDGNDYWVWDAITSVKPWIVISEYNATFGDLQPLTVPYDARFSIRDAHYSGAYFGTSIGALKVAATKHGYSLIGSNRAGLNAFFVRNDLISKIVVDDKRALPSIFTDTRNRAGDLSYVRGPARRDLIADMPVQDVSTGKILNLGDAGEIYSDHWKAVMAGHPVS